ncbi:TlpA disulfide reductase family protein [Brevibacillus sp. B_LB10_24]|uniref:TlpA disulfide reductase family protein n=1 Tax=Brevibacillus sp. B_LB10_24 TaxID=3380645 RepID=UPI0038BD8EDA
MKKNIVAILVLLGLIVWGVYSAAKPGDIGGAKPAGESALQDGSDAKSLQTGIEQGNLAPDFELQTTAGQSIKLSDLKGKKVILNVWATWCPPCRAEMPDMQKFYAKHEKEDITILSVNAIKTEKNPDDVPKFIEAFGLAFPVVLDQEGLVSNTYQVAALPTSYLIDTQGIIRQKVIGPMDLEIMEKLVSQMN